MSKGFTIKATAPTPKKSDDEFDLDSNDVETDKNIEKKAVGKNVEKSDEETDEETDQYKKQLNRYKNSEESQSDMFEPNCETDDSYRRKEISLIDDKCKPYLYLGIPKPIYKNIITPAKRVQEQLTKHFNFGDDYFKGVKLSVSNTYVQDFKMKNERYVGLLAKEFEMRKAAKAFSKSKLSDTVILTLLNYLLINLMIIFFAK
jgi:hypothetical protein